MDTKLPKITKMAKCPIVTNVANINQQSAIMNIIVHNNGQVY